MSGALATSYKCAIAVCRRQSSQRRRPAFIDDGLCWKCRRAARQKDAYLKAKAVTSRDIIPLPDAPCWMTSSETSLVLVGEVTAAAWDGIGDALAYRIDEPAVVLDLSAVSHARSLPSRVAGYVQALRQRGTDVIVRASPYVRACMQASRYGSALDVRWVTP